MCLLRWLYLPLMQCIKHLFITKKSALAECACRKAELLIRLLLRHFTLTTVGVDLAWCTLVSISSVLLHVCFVRWMFNGCCWK